VHLYLLYPIPENPIARICTCHHALDPLSWGDMGVLRSARLVLKID